MNETETPTLLPVITGLHEAGYPKAFTLSELELYNAAAAKHDLEGLTEEASLESSKGTLDTRNVRLESVQKGIEALQKQLDAEYAKTKWDEGRINALIDQLEAQTTQERELLLSAAPERIKQSREQEALYARLLEAQDRVNAEAVTELAKLHKITTPGVDELLGSATGDDLDAIADIIERGLEGASPLNRAGRRASRKRQRALN